MQRSTIKINLRSTEGESTGTAELHAIARETAVKKGCIAWLGCWVGALFTLPIPLVHFVAPPILILVGPVAGFILYKSFKGAIDVVSANAPCPNCSACITFGPCAEAWPKDLICHNCDTRLQAFSENPEALK